jgi:hypothetical protein
VLALAFVPFQENEIAETGQLSAASLADFSF